MSDRTGLLLLGLWLAAPATAVAATVNVTLCVDINVDYDHASGGDRFTNNSVNQPARGFRYVVKDNNAGGAIVYDDILSDGDDGPAAGCSAAFPLTVGGSYKINVHPEGTVDGSDFEHLGGEAKVLYAAYTPSWPVTLTPVVDGVLYHSFSQALAMAYALNLHDGGTTGELFQMDDDRTAHGCKTSGGIVHLHGGSNPTMSKYTIVHEVGHLVAAKTDGGGAHPSPGNNSLNNCQGTGTPGDSPNDDEDDTAVSGLLNKKYMSNSITEGLANFYAAITWNDRDDPDCDYITNKPHNLDLTGTAEIARDAVISCVDDDDQGSPDYFDGVNWLDDLIDASDALGCTTPRTNRSTTFDWLRYLWALHNTDSGAGLDADEIYDIWHDATIDDWDGDGSDANVPDPWPQWEAAANDLQYTAHQAWRKHVQDAGNPDQ